MAKFTSNSNDSYSLVKDSKKFKKLLLGIVLFVLMSAIAVLTSSKGISGAILVLIGVAGLLFIAKLVQSPYLLLFMSMIYATAIGPFLMSFSNVPIGIAMDGALLTGMVSIVYQNYRNQIKGYFFIPGGIIILVWIAYHLVQFANPLAPSRIAWFYVMRPAVAYPFLFFLAYHYIDSVQKAKRILLIWFTLMSISAIWGLIQHIFGYFSFEFRFLQAADALRLVFIQGRYRIFGTLTSPAQFGVIMGIVSSSSLIYFMLEKGKSRWFMILVFLLSFFAMIYSGTRTAMVVLPFSLGVFVVVTKNVKFISIGVVLAFFLAILMVMPTTNYHIQRMQSTFKTEEDASFQVRADNRKMITPFILSHPLGGGLGSTGVWGMRFSPWSPLAQFAPDSGYIRVSVELGTLGMVIYAIVLLRLFYLGIFPCFSSNSEIKTISISLFASLSSLLLIEWAQDIIGKIPFNVFFWILMAVLIKLKHLSSAEEVTEL